MEPATEPRATEPGLPCILKLGRGVGFVRRMRQYGTPGNQRDPETSRDTWLFRSVIHFVILTQPTSQRELAVGLQRLCIQWLQVTQLCDP